VNAARIVGSRGLDGGSSLARPLAGRRGGPNRAARPALSAELIREWAVAHARRAGSWPRRESGAIPESPGDTWLKVQQARERGLPGGSSLPRLLRECIKEAVPVIDLG
jgi:hypothetical protein